MAVVKNTYVEEETFVKKICVQPKHPFSYNIAHSNDSDKNVSLTHIMPFPKLNLQKSYFKKSQCYSFFTLQTVTELNDHPN